jgi:hypothetical protein
VRDLGNGMFEVQGAHGTVQMREEDVPWDRMTPEEAEAARNARAAQTNPTTSSATGTPPTASLTNDQKIRQKIDERLARETTTGGTPRKFEDLSPTEQQDYMNEAKGELGI